MWGIFLIILGVVFTLARMDVIDLHQWRTWWPLLMIAFGVARILAPGRARQKGGGVTFVLVGVWFYACTQHWYGLTFRNAWPILVVVAGVEMVLVAMIDRIKPDWKKEEEHHA
jgi:hypothetical protein